MDTKNFLNKVCNQIKYEPVRVGISEELKLHINEIKEEYINEGMKEKEAEEKAVLQMGEAEEIGKKLNKIHRPKLDWKLLILMVILIGFGITISILKDISTDANYLAKTIEYIVIGGILSIGVYFFNYKKLEKYSIFIYLIATFIMFLPMFETRIMVNGAHYIRLFGKVINPTTIALPLYVIAFIGFISKYDKNNIIKIQIQDEKFFIKKDLIKILALSIISCVLMTMIPSVACLLTLFFTYIIVATIKIVQEKNIKLLILTYGTILVLGILLLISVFASPYRYVRLLASYKPELYPQGAGYTGMLQKEILENSKLIGEAETEVISSNDYIITKESNYTFIYLLGKTGILVASGLVLTIILISAKLILNAKNMKEQYGKLLIIGLSIMYIFQSISSVLMNINLGIKADIDLPFVAYGGVYFIVNILCMAVILSVYRKKDVILYE